MIKAKYFVCLFQKNKCCKFASIIVIFTSVVNISPAFAQSMSNIPVVNSIVKLVNFKTYTAKNGNMEANINVAKVEGLSNKELENQLNSKFIEEGQKNTAIS